MRRAIRLSLLPFLASFSACSGSPPAIDRRISDVAPRPDAAPSDAGMGELRADAPKSDATSTPTARFILPTSTPVDFAAVPFPSDLYLDATGHLALGALPVGPAACTSAIPLIQATLDSLDGAGVETPSFYKIDGGPVKAASATSAVHLYAIGSGGSDGGGSCAELPLVTEYRSDLGYVVARLGAGVVLDERSRYASVLTDALVQDSGSPVLASADFLAARDATSRPSEAHAAAAYDVVQAALACATAAGIGKSHVIAAASYRTESLQKDLQNVHAQVVAATPLAVTLRALITTTSTSPCTAGTTGCVNPLGGDIASFLGTPRTASDGMTHAGIDNPGGVLQSHIGAIVQGTFPEASYTQPGRFQKGRFVYDSTGTPTVRSTIPLDFTLVLPNTTQPATGYPVVIFQHGITGDRVTVYALADGFAAKGFAVFGIDLPFHGSRNPSSSDKKNEVTGASTPDYVGDSAGIQSASDLFDLDGDSSVTPPVQPLDTTVMRDTLRQGTIDLMEVVQLLQRGGFSAIGAADSALKGLTLDGAHIAMTGESFGSYVAGVFLAEEPAVGLGAISVAPGGLILPTLMDSPAFGSTFIPFLDGAYDLSAEIVDDDSSPMHAKWDPMINLFQLALEPGDALAYAPILAQRIALGQINLLLNAVYSDEVVPNQSTEPYAEALGLPLLSTSESPPAPAPRYAMLAGKSLPYAGNAGSGKVTTGFLETAPGTHDVATSRYGTEKYAPSFPPTRPISGPDGGALPSGLPVVNATDQVQREWNSFASQWATGTVPPALIDPTPWP